MEAQTAEAGARAGRVQFRPALTAFMDESKTERTDGAFVLAGYIGRSDAWAQFSSEWQELLAVSPNHYRRLDAFHFREMKSERDLERLDWFYKVIEKYASAAISLVIDMRALRKTFSELAWPQPVDADMLSNPYLIAFQSTLGGIPRIQRTLGFDSPIDFVFDENSDKAKCLHGWELMKRNAPPEVLPLLGATPTFRDDKTTLPLQAADLWAGVTRIWGQGVLAGASASEFNLPVQRRMPVLQNFWNEDRLRARYRHLHASVVRRLSTLSS